MSAMSEARKKANKKWNDANMKERYDRIQLVVPKGRKEEIQAEAERRGQSVNGFINGLIDEALSPGSTAASPAGAAAGGATVGGAVGGAIGGGVAVDGTQQRPVQPQYGADVPGVGSDEQAAQRAPRSATEGAGGTDDTPGTVSIFQPEGGAPASVSCPISQEPQKTSPSETMKTKGSLN